MARVIQTRRTGAMSSPLAQQQLDNFWANWKPEMEALGLTRKQAGQIVGMALKACNGSITKAGKALGAVRESKPSPEDVVRYLKQEMRDADGKTSC